MALRAPVAAATRPPLPAPGKRLMQMSDILSSTHSTQPRLRATVHEARRCRSATGPGHHHQRRSNEAPSALSLSAKYAKSPSRGLFAYLAEREGFEPSIRLTVYTLSRRAPSATRPPLQIVFQCPNVPVVARRKALMRSRSGDCSERSGARPRIVPDSRPFGAFGIGRKSGPP